MGATNDIGADAILQGLFSLSMMESYISSGLAGNSSEVTLLSLIVKQVVSDTCLYVRKFAWSMLCWLCIHVQQYNTSNIDHITWFGVSSSFCWSLHFHWMSPCLLVACCKVQQYFGLQRSFRTFLYCPCPGPEANSQSHGFHRP